MELRKWSAEEIALQMGLDPTNRSQWPAWLKEEDAESRTVAYVQYECPMCKAVISVPFKNVPMDSPLCVHGELKLVMLLGGFVDINGSQEKHPV